MQMRLYEEVVLKDRNGVVWEGEVVTDLTLSIWAETEGYEIVEVGGFRNPEITSRTLLHPPVRKFSGTFEIVSLGKLMSR